MVETKRSSEPLDVEELSSREIGVIEDLLKLLEEAETLSEKALNVEEEVEGEPEKVAVATLVEDEEKKGSPFSPSRLREMADKLESELGQESEESEEEGEWLDADEANLTLEERLQKLEEKEEGYTSEEIMKMLDLVFQIENESEK